MFPTCQRMHSQETETIRALEKLLYLSKVSTRIGVWKVEVAAGNAIDAFGPQCAAPPFKSGIAHHAPPSRMRVSATSLFDIVRDVRDLSSSATSWQS